MTIKEQEQIEGIKEHFGSIMKILGLDMTDSELKDTPKRVAKMYVTELFSGLNTDNEPKMTVFPNKKGYDQLVALTNIEVASTCAHHMLPFPMKVSIAYIPGPNYVGISKLARVAKHFAKKPQTQEVFVAEVSDYIQKHLQPLGLMVYAEGKHMCMSIRGIEMPDATMITSELKGLFRQNLELETKFLNMIKR